VAGVFNSDDERYVGDNVGSFGAARPCRDGRIDVRLPANGSSSSTATDVMRTARSASAPLDPTAPTRRRSMGWTPPPAGGVKIGGSRASAVWASSGRLSCPTDGEPSG
jgi:hypothetical protein